MAQGYAFLVARGRRTGFRTLLAPGFLIERDLHHVLAESTGASGAPSDEARVVVLDSPAGPFSVGYTSEPVERAEIEPPGAHGGELLEDEHGRALEIVYGVVCRDGLPGPLDAEDLRTARAQALRRYRRFLVDEAAQRVEPSAPFALRGAAPRRAAGGEPAARSAGGTPRRRRLRGIAASMGWRRRVANGLLALLPIAGLLAFVLVHSGARGVRICEDHGFAGPGSLSWWPPGTTCRRGEPAVEEIVFSPTFVVVLVAVSLLLVGASAIVKPARDGGRT